MGKRESRKEPQAQGVMADRLPPHSIEAEQGVLGCTLLSPTECMMQLIPMFPGSEVFYDLRHRAIYELLCVMHDAREPMDLITVQQRLKDENKLEAIGGLAYLASLPDAVPTAANLDHYAKIMLDKFRLRTVIRGCVEIVGRCYDDEKEAIALMEQTQRDLLAITQRTTNRRDWTVKDAIRGALKDIERDMESRGAVTGLSTGFADIDQKTRGLQNGDFIVIAARPSMGKSSLVTNIAENVAVDQRRPVAIFSLEMSKKSLMRRMLSARSRVNLFHLGEDLMAKHEMDQISKAYAQIGGAPLFIDDSRGLDDVQIRANLRQMFHEYGIQLAVIDYLQLLRTRRRYDKRLDEIAAISEGCKTIAGELNIPVIVCAQLNREVAKDKSQRPRIHHLREAGNIEQDADVIGLIYAKDPDDEEAQITFKVPCGLDIGKQRNGPTGTIHMMFLKFIMRFELACKIDDTDVPRDIPPDPRCKD